MLGGWRQKVGSERRVVETTRRLRVFPYYNAKTPIGNSELVSDRLMLPESGSSNEREAQIKQTVNQLLRELNDLQTAAKVITNLVTNHAPALLPWVGELLKQRGARGIVTVRPAPQTPEQLFKAIYGVAPQIVTPPPPPADYPALRVDPELGRLAVLLDQTQPFRLWLIGRELTRDADGSGQITTAALTAALKRFGVTCDARTIRRLLAGGDGIFWNRDRDRLFLRSWGYVAVQFTTQAARRRGSLLERNRPGRREIYIQVGGGKERFAAQLYAGWLAGRSDPTISREALTALFGRDRKTLRRWERDVLPGQINPRANFAQCPDWETFYDSIPEHAVDYRAAVRFKGRVQRITRYRWQLPNTYLTTGVKEHYRAGQARKVRKAVNAELSLPASFGRGGPLKLYFDKPEHLHRMLRKNPEAGPRYVWRGEDQSSKGIFEINETGFPLTHAKERVILNQRRRL